MIEEALLPGWQCVCEGGDPELVRTMLANHGIDAEVVVPLGSWHKYSQPTVWVRDGDYERAATLVDQMAKSIENPPTGLWKCQRCGEENEAQFDICWKCGYEPPILNE